MSSNGIAAKLIAGQQNIDVMRKEIRDVIKMLLGLLRLEDLYFLDKSARLGDRRGKTFSEDKYEWQILADGDRVQIQCYIHSFVPGVYSGYRIPYRITATLNKDSKDFKEDWIFGITHAQDVRDGLDVFVNGMMATFPKLPDQVEPFLRAAERKV